MNEGRQIRIERDAVGNTLITGDSNVVVFQVGQVLQEEQLTPTSIGPNPYKGLAAFDEDDADYFFGREAITLKLWNALRSLHEPSPGESPPVRLLPIIGPSGCGKSSVARAGLIPEMARRALPGLSAPQVAVFTPGANPLLSLAAVLARIATGDTIPVAKSREFSDELCQINANGEYDGLRRIAGFLPNIATSSLIVLVDQFEEVYSLCDDPAKRDCFVQNLLSAAADRTGWISVILTLRSDFIGPTVHHLALNRAIASNGVIVPTMDRDELHRAISEPARRAGHPIDDATVDLLVSETEGREGALPLLQFTLTRIWEGLREGISAAETLRNLNGVGGALAEEAQRLYKSLPDPDKQIARRAFLHLVRLGEGTQDTRRRAALSEIVATDEDPEHVLDVLRIFSRPGARLITLSGDSTSEVSAVVTHEALFEHWGQLREWLNDGRDDIRFHRRLAAAVKHWDEQDRPDGLLWRPPDLDLLRKFHARASRDMTKTQITFYRESQKKEQRAKTRKRLTAISLGLLAAVALGFAIFAEQQRREANVARMKAEFEQQMAFSKELLALSEAKTPINAQCGLVLALRAYQTAQVISGVDLFRFANNLRKTLALSYVDATWEGYTGQVDDVAWSPRGDLVAAASHVAEEVRLTATDATDTVYSLPFRNPTTLAWAPDEQLLAVGNGYGQIAVWDIGQDLNKIDEFKLHSGIQGLAWSPSNRQLAITLLEGFSVHIRDVNKGELISYGIPSSYTGIPSWSPDGSRLAVPVQAGSVLAIDSRKWDPIGLFGGHRGTVVNAAWDTDGARLAAASDDSTVRIWSVETGELLAILAGHNNQVMRTLWSPDGKVIASASWDGSIKLWDPDLGRVIHTMTAHTSGVTDIAWSPDGRRLASGSQDETVRIWNAESSHGFSLIHKGDRWMWDTAWSPDGRYLASASDDSTVKLWDTMTDDKLELSGHRKPVTRVAWTAAGDRLATASLDNTVRIWNVKQLSEPPMVLPHEAEVFGLAWNSDGKKIATTFLGLRDPVSGVAVWDAVGGAQEAIAAAFSPAVAWIPGVESWAFSDLEKGEVLLWNIKSKSKIPLGRFQAGVAVWDLDVSPNGDWLAAALDDNTARVWALESSSNYTLAGHTSDVKGVAWSPDGGRLATGSLDGTIRVWDVQSSKTLSIYYTHGIGVRGISWSPDGSMLAAADEDGGVRVFQTRMEDVLAQAREQLARGLTKREREQCIQESLERGR